LTFRQVLIVEAAELNRVRRGRTPTTGAWFLRGLPRLRALDQDVPRDVVPAARAAVLVELDALRLEATPALSRLGLGGMRRPPALRDAPPLWSTRCGFGKCSSMAAAPPASNPGPPTELAIRRAALSSGGKEPGGEPNA
jgi:hypothetical protein